MTYTRFEQIFFNYFEQFKRLMEASPLVLGGISGAGGGIGGRPGGFVGVLPQINVAFDQTEDESLTIPDSGASLVDNLNRIRYRIATLEGSLVNDFLDLLDTPNTYSGEANKYLSVKGSEDGVEFITVVPSGDNFKVKVSSDDTTEDFLENKLTEGNNITITVIDAGGNEKLEIASISGVTDHGILTGLGDDDHSQYLNEARHDITTRHTLGSVVPHDSLNNLSNVLINSPVDGETLTYDNATGKWINSTGGVTTFLNLSDVPDTYTDQAGKAVIVKDDETGLEFINISGAGAASKVMTFGVMGQLSVSTLEARLYSSFNGTISNIVTTVNTAPQGSSIILDISKNGSTIFTTSGYPTITAGNNDDMSCVPDITTVSINDLFIASITQVGSTTPGSDLILQIRCNV